jgi:hypothetical protein
MNFSVTTSASVVNTQTASATTVTTASTTTENPLLAFIQYLWDALIDPQGSPTISAHLSPGP